MKYLLTGLGLGIVTLAWASFVYLNFDIADKRIDGWLHAAILPFLFLIILVVPFIAALFSKSAIAGILIYASCLGTLFVVSALAYLMYSSEGCPRPYTQERLEERRQALSDPQKFLSDWKNRYRLSNPTDTWEPNYQDYEKELARFDKDYSVYKGGCSGYESGSSVPSLSVETPETFEAFLGSLVADIRVPFFAILWGLAITLPISLIGGFVGSKMFKKEQQL